MQRQIIAALMEEEMNFEVTPEAQVYIDQLENLVGSKFVVTTQNEMMDSGILQRPEKDKIKYIFGYRFTYKSLAQERGSLQTVKFFIRDPEANTDLCIGNLLSLKHLEEIIGIFNKYLDEKTKEDIDENKLSGLRTKLKKSIQS